MRYVSDIDWTTLDLEELPGDLAEVAELFEEGGPFTCAQILDRLVGHFGGSRLYVPFLKQLKREMRNEAIVRAYDGSNARELAREHGLSAAYAEQLIARRDRAFLEDLVEATGEADVAALARRHRVHPAYLSHLLARHDGQSNLFG